MKHLTILYDGRELFDADVAQFDWSESETGISVKARTQPRSNGSGLNDLLERMRAARPSDNPGDMSVTPESHTVT